MLFIKHSHAGQEGVAERRARSDTASWSKRHPEMHGIHMKAMENGCTSASSAIDIAEWFELPKKCKWSMILGI
jgi:hypothetical protein